MSSSSHSSTSAERMRDKRERDKGIQAARARGRALGEDEANRRGDFAGVVDTDKHGNKHDRGAKRAERIARAEAYAVWEYEGRPLKEQPDLEPYWPKGTPADRRRH